MGGAYQAPGQVLPLRTRNSLQNTSSFIKTATERVEKVVLVTVGERKRPVTFLSSADPSKVKEPLLNAIKDVIDDILREEENGAFSEEIRGIAW